MKTKITFFAILLLAVMLSGGTVRTAESDTPITLAGTWRLVSIQNTGQPLVVIPEDSPIVFQKKFNDTHFTSVNFTPDGQIGRINGGTYTLNGDVYIEHIQYAVPSANQVNTSIQFRIEFRGHDEFSITGILPTARPGMYFTEVWRREIVEDDWQ